MNKEKSHRRMSREDRRAQIIDSAMKVFIEKGYNGATTADISKEAEISEVTLFRYFSSKKELFMEVLEPILIISLENSIVESKDLQDVEKLKYILKDRINFVSNNHQVMKLILMESQINPELADLDYINKIASLLKKSIKETGVKLKNEKVSSRLLIGSIFSFLYFPEVNEEKIEEYIDNLILIITE